MDARKGAWPDRKPVLGVNVSVTTYGEETDCVIRAAKARTSSCVTHLAVHGLVTGALDGGLRRRLNAFDLVAPDGMPVKTALNVLFGAGLPEHTRGPESTLRICERAAAESIGVYLYGSAPDTVSALRRNLLAKYPGLAVAGAEPSLFRPLTRDEDEALAGRINASGAGIVLLGLGCPLQEHFAYEHRGRISAVMVCVGAAFDFHAGVKKPAPEWMQRNALEWLFRLGQEPGRLWKRYLYTNSLFMLLFAAQYAKTKLGFRRRAVNRANP